MTPHQIDLVRTSFARVQPIAPQAAALFYDKLFARDPALRRLFKGDMVHQGERLMAMIGVAVAGLARPDQLHAPLKALGERHAGYGVQPSHYDTVGAALLETLAEGLGPAFTGEVRAAWVALYGHVSHTMQSFAVQPA
jgi:hemoglobin-like flavoprotein